MQISELEQSFPSFELEGKLSFGEGDIDRSRRCYVKKKSRNGEVLREEEK